MKSRPQPSHAWPSSPPPPLAVAVRGADAATTVPSYLPVVNWTCTLVPTAGIDWVNGRSPFAVAAMVAMVRVATAEGRAVWRMQFAMHHAHDGCDTCMQYI